MSNWQTEKAEQNRRAATEHSHQRRERLEELALHKPLEGRECKKERNK
jgi:hypothetical protein